MGPIKIIREKKRPTAAEGGGVLAVLLGQPAGDRVHVVAFQGREARVEERRLDGGELDALDGGVVEAVLRRVQRPEGAGRARVALTARMLGVEGNRKRHRDVHHECSWHRPWM